ncbi:MAG: DDE-type integrase/transposase/recombinase [bacterium]|nr:DDE-type integrase/transposase/recombinase [bacterium]
MPLKPSYPKEKRILWYQGVERDKRSVTDACLVFGISRKTYYKWRKRDFGMSSNTHDSMKRNTKLIWEVRKFIEENKLAFNYGPLKMKMLVKKEMGLSISTTIIYRYYKRRKLIRKPQRKFLWYAPMKHHLVAQNPGEGVQVDVKYVYESGQRKFQFSVFDPFTLKYHFTIFHNKESKNSILAFQNAEIYFGFKISSVQTDNGSEFRGAFHEWLTVKNIPHYFIPKKSPWWNANVERVHRTIDEEFYQNANRIWKTSYEWLEFYNFQRIHLTLNGLTPHEKYLQSVTLDC